MKKSSLLKSVVVIALSILLVANLVSVVFADDDTFGWDDPTITNSSNTNESNTIDNTNSITTNSITTTNTTNTINTFNTTNTSISTENATTILNTSTNESENEVNSLAYTGVENNSALVVVILIGAIVAGYSLKKIRDYNNI